jgi:glycosyltransferase involved in cell wall biosynthesis
VFAFWQWLLPALAVGVTVNTRFLAERMRRRGIQRVVYVPNGVDLAVFKPPAPRLLAALRTSLGLDGATVVAYFGTIALHNHPIDLLLEAFRLPALADPAVRLLLVGGGEDLPAVREWIRDQGMDDRIQCTGHVPRAAVPFYVALATLTVDPVHDNEVARARSPLKLFESMALGLPVVTGAVGDRPELLGAAGVVTATQTPAALAEAIHAILADPAGRASLADHALAQVQRYTWQTLGLQLLRGYESRYPNL